MKGENDLDEIYREYAGPLYRYLFTLCGERQTAEELTQESFFRAVKNIDSFDGSCRLFTWLCQIGKHVWYQELDRRRRHSAQPLDESLPSGDGPAELTESEEERLRLYRAVMELKSPGKDVVWMRLTGELSFRQIGDIMGKTESWARVTFYRAKARLIQLMREENGDG